MYCVLSFEDFDIFSNFARFYAAIIAVSSKKAAVASNFFSIGKIFRNFLMPKIIESAPKTYDVFKCCPIEWNIF